MFAFNHATEDGFSGRIVKYVGDAPQKQLVLTCARLGPWRLLRWLYNEAWRNSTNRELNLLNDYCLDDIGVRRRVDLRTDDLVKRLRAGG
jgi:uncharacterized protein YjiS (DUF1127 family)